MTRGLTNMPPKRKLRGSEWLFALVFAFLVIVPVSMNGIRAALLLVLFAYVAAQSVGSGTLKYGHWSFLLTAITVSTGCLWAMYGILADNPGAVFLTALYIVWPVIYVAFSASIKSVGLFQFIHKIILASSLFIFLFTMNFVAISQGLIGDNVLNQLDLGQAIAFHGGYTEMRLYPISSLIFIIPYLAAWLVFQPEKRGQNYVLTACVLLASITVAVLSGRRALMLTMLVAPLLFAGVWGGVWLAAHQGTFRRVGVRMTRTNLRLTIILAMVATPVLLFFDYSQIAGLIEYVQSAFVVSQDEATQIRVEQGEILMRHWGHHPLVGYGMGAATEYVRSNPERPWEYELQYPMMLFQFGLLGFAVYVGSVLTVFWQGLRTALRAQMSSDAHAKAGMPYLLASLTGLLAFVMANASNPYFQAFGHLWTLFLPIGMICALQRRLAKTR